MYDVLLSMKLAISISLMIMHRSDVNIEKKVKPIIEPCGTQDSISYYVLNSCLILVLYFQF